MAWPRHCLLLLIALLCSSGLRAVERSVLDTPTFSQVGDAEQIPDQVITALTQDAAGYLWIGTTAGLVRYDGYNFRRYRHDPSDPQHSLGGNNIRSLRPRAGGGLWIGTDVDGLSAFDPVSETFTTWRHDPQRPDGITFGQVFALAEAADGSLWLGSRGGGLDHFQPQQGRWQHYRAGRDGLLDDHVNVLLLDRAGRLWLGSGSGLMRRSEDGRFHAVLSAPGDPLAGRTLYSLFEASDGWLWVGSREGDLLRFDPASGEHQLLTTAHQGEMGGTASVFSCQQPSAQEVWCGRANGIEIRSLDGRLLEHLQRHPGRPGTLAGNDIRALLIDHSGVIWAAGFGSGLQRHDPNNRGLRVLRHLPTPRGLLNEPDISAVLQSADGRIWLGTRGLGVAVLGPDWQLEREILPEPQRAGGLPTGWVSALAEAADGAIWMGSREGLHRLDPASQQFTSVGAADGFTASYVRRLQLAPDGALWIASNRGVFVRPNGQTRVAAVPMIDQGEVGGDVNAIAFDLDGGVWVGAGLGLFHRPPGGHELLRIDAGAEAAALPVTVVGLLVDSRDRLWVDSPEGLYRLLRLEGRQAVFDPVSRRLGVIGRAFGANLMEDAQGRIWSHQFVFDPERDWLYALSPADGVDFGTGWFRAYTASREGLLLVGGSRGLLVIDPPRFSPWTFAPQVVISELKVDGQTRAVGAQLQLGANVRGFSAEFAALDYTAPAALRYRYRLLGYDERWRETSAAYRVASYNSLWPGDYVLEVEASNRAGRWSESQARLPLQVQAAYWQTPWFGLLGLLLLLASGYATLRWRTRQIQRRAGELQALVELRTGELRAAKDSAEAALSELQATQQQLVAAEKMASLGQLVAGVAHEINTPIGIALTAASHVQETLAQQGQKLAEGKLSRRDMERWQQSSEEAVGMVLSSLHRAHTLVATFKQIAVDQSGEQRRQFALAPWLEDVRVSLESVFQPGGHQLEIDCPLGVELDSYPGALFQVLSQLVGNAVTHGFADGRQGRIELQVSRQREQLVLQLRDDGLGMSAEVAAHAFEPFFTTRRGSGGSGLGLHLVFNLITQLLGGRIELHSQPGAGCEYRIELPLQAPLRAVEHH